ncbi:MULTISPECIES: GAF domain-containing protein [Sphingobacterium]|uniref:GAF domain-containing protein n=1 Tax=Sphingobacterium hotanense TaxID=649196 RepID=A0ABT7NP66_9SPHI|nr:MULTISPECIES: GAF domain-containing protein [Sphingobacterium]MDM1049049.1 GAF domain-containing protein [Sphingobacterium hotanense]
MAEDLSIAQGSKEDQYLSLVPQIKGLISGETNQVANMANIAAALKEQFNFFWVGFYLVEGEQLVLGPFQGPVACTRIAYNRGVCGTAWAKQETLVVPNVEEFPGHIACSSLSKSEIVVPILKDGQCIGVLDVDSAELNTFDDVDVKYLLQIIKYFVENII